MTLFIKRRIWWLRRKYYEVFYGYKYGFGGTMLPQLGKGKFVSVFRKGNYLEIQNHVINAKRLRKGMIRLIPYQPNHGVMVEFTNEEGKIEWARTCSYDDFYAMSIGTKEKTIA